MIGLKDIVGDGYIVPNVLYRLENSLKSSNGDVTVDIAHCSFTPLALTRLYTILKSYNRGRVTIVNNTDAMLSLMCKSMTTYINGEYDDSAYEELEFKGNYEQALSIINNLNTSTTYKITGNKSNNLFSFISILVLTRTDITISLGSLLSDYVDWTKSIIGLCDYTESGSLLCVSGLSLVEFAVKNDFVEKIGFMGGCNSNTFLSMYKVLPGDFGSVKFDSDVDDKYSYRYMLLKHSIKSLKEYKENKTVYKSIVDYM